MEAVDSPSVPYKDSANADRSCWKVTVDFDVTPHVVSVAKETLPAEYESVHTASASDKPLTYKISSVRGCAFPVPCNETRWEYLNNRMHYRPSDILVVTYPKCGTTWVEQVVLLLLYPQDASSFDIAGKNCYHPVDNPFGKIWPEACIDQEPCFGVTLGKAFSSVNLG
jgi:hypothetical protein